MIRQVGQTAFAGGSSRRIRQPSRSCNFEMCLRRRFISVITPPLRIIADRKDITCMVLPNREHGKGGMSGANFGPGLNSLWTYPEVPCEQTANTNQGKTWTTHKTHVVPEKPTSAIVVSVPEKLDTFSLIITQISVDCCGNLRIGLLVQYEGSLTFLPWCQRKPRAVLQILFQDSGHHKFAQKKNV